MYLIRRLASSAYLSSASSYQFNSKSTEGPCPPLPQAAQHGGCGAPFHPEENIHEPLFPPPVHQALSDVQLTDAERQPAKSGPA